MFRIANWILSSFVFISLLCCCGKEGNSEEGNEQTTAPTSITADPASITAEQVGGTFSVKLTAPARPKVSGVPGWITFKDGTFNPSTYQMTVTLTVSTNGTTSERSADLTVSAKGATDITIKVTQPGKEVIKDPTLPDNTAVRRTMEPGLGWNMGNHFDAYTNGVSGETAWGNPKATQATFDGVKAAGFTTVRIPVTWLGHIGAAPTYTIEEAWINRVYEVVGYAENAGMNVILNTHHDEDHGEGHWQNLKEAVLDEATNTQIKEEIAAVWTQIAEKFKSKGDFLMLESFNELIYGNEWSSSSNTERKCAVINEWNQVFVDVVRATGGNNATRWLGVPGYAASPNYIQYLTVPNDPAKKTMLAFHCYDPYDYTIGDKQLPDWGHTGTSFTRGEEEIKTLFNGIYTNYIANDIPVYMGEFGCSMRDKNNSKAWAYYLYYLEYVVKCAKTFGIAPTLWDNGAKGTGKERHAYIDHASGQYVGNSREPVAAMVKAWKTDSEGYTLQTIYNSAPTNK
ncbi:MAG: cellulase family glycosylhydrolase [Bacteroidales bacterium]|nr:cellulase family glycosylhydrolase [Bacteroidales bacterium]